MKRDTVLAEPVLHCDETTVQVLKSEKAVSSDHYMIVRAAGPPGRRIVLYNYAPTRNVETLKQILTGPDGPYRGKLVCDGLELYDFVGEDKLFNGMTLCGCLTHCRRYYDKAAKVTESPQANSSRASPSKTCLARSSSSNARSMSNAKGGPFDFLVQSLLEVLHAGRSSWVFQFSEHFLG